MAHSKREHEIDGLRKQKCGVYKKKYPHSVKRSTPCIHFFPQLRTFLSSVKERERERERERCIAFLYTPQAQWGMKFATWICALIRNQTCGLLVHRKTCQPTEPHEPGPYFMYTSGQTPFLLLAPTNPLVLLTIIISFSFSSCSFFHFFVSFSSFFLVICKGSDTI